MDSAFGIDHGYEEIEKFGLAGLGGSVAGGTKKLAGALGRPSAGLRRGVATNPSPIGAAKMGVGTAGGRAAGGLRKLGAGMAKRPGLTGGVAAGGAGVGAGGMFANRRRF